MKMLKKADSNSVWVGLSDDLELRIRPYTHDILLRKRVMLPRLRKAIAYVEEKDPGAISKLRAARVEFQFCSATFFSTTIYLSPTLPDTWSSAILAQLEQYLAYQELINRRSRVENLLHAHLRPAKLSTSEEDSFYTRLLAEDHEIRRLGDWKQVYFSKTELDWSWSQLVAHIHGLPKTSTEMQRVPTNEASNKLAQLIQSFPKHYGLSLDTLPCCDYKLLEYSKERLLIFAQRMNKVLMSFPVELHGRVQSDLFVVGLRAIEGHHVYAEGAYPVYIPVDASEEEIRLALLGSDVLEETSFLWSEELCRKRKVKRWTTTENEAENRKA